MEFRFVVSLSRSRCFEVVLISTVVADRRVTPEVDLNPVLRVMRYLQPSCSLKPDFRISMIFLPDEMVKYVESRMPFLSENEIFPLMVEESIG